MVRFSGIFTAIILTLVFFTTSCSYNDRSELPDSAGSDGRGDATNTLRYQNRTVK